jgi:hypothetical protein
MFSRIDPDRLLAHEGDPAVILLPHPRRRPKSPAGFAAEGMRRDDTQQAIHRYSY